MTSDRLNSPTMNLATDRCASELLHHLRVEEGSEGVEIRMDPNGTIPLYRLRGSDRISTSPLDLARDAGLTPSAEACGSFLMNGVFYDGAAFHPDLEALPAASILRFGPRGCVVSVADDSDPWSRDTGNGPEALIAAIVEALHPLEGLRVVCDLTGGFDARLVALCLRRAGIPFTGSVTGAVDAEDVLLAGRLARHLGVELRHERQEAGEDLATWRDALIASGGVLGVRQAARLLALQSARADSFDVSVGGLGGELLRDFWWLQEPAGLESGAAPDWRRLVRSRLYQSPMPAGLLRGEWAEAIAGEVERRTAWFDEGTKRDAPARKRDRLDYAYMRMHAPRWIGAAMATSIQRIRLHHPILHPDVLAVGMGAPLRGRRAGDMVRRAITMLDPAAAAIPMAGGGNALPLVPTRPWRYLPVLRQLARAVRRRLPGGRAGTPAPAWGDKPLTLEALTGIGAVDADRVFEYRTVPGSLAAIERLQTLDLLPQEL